MTQNFIHFYNTKVIWYLDVDVITINFCLYFNGSYAIIDLN